MAFVRLQLSVVEKNKDESIFAWAMNSSNNTRPWSGLLPASPSLHIDCKDVRTTPGSSGFSMSNGELSIRLQTFPHSMETYFAVLNCTDCPSSSRRVAIFVTRSSTDDEYLRIRDSRGISKMSRATLQMKSLKERLLRVPIDSSDPPLNRFYGFWLRSLEPPDRMNRHTSILCRHQALDVNHVCLDEYEMGTAGIAHIEPKNSSLHSGWSKIRWVKFGFDIEFIPMLLIANSKSSGSDNIQLSRLRPSLEIFEQAIASKAGS